MFVDAIGAGLSQAVAPFTNVSFFGVDRDAAAFRDFITRYVDVNGRRASPKFLFGESYGTTRSGVLAHLLETAGVTLARRGAAIVGARLRQQLRRRRRRHDQLRRATCRRTRRPAPGMASRRRRRPISRRSARNVQAFTLDTYAPAVMPFILDLVLPPQPVIDTLVARHRHRPVAVALALQPRPVHRSSTAC